jgi:hypothetical protein
MLPVVKTLLLYYTRAGAGMWCLHQGKSKTLVFNYQSQLDLSIATFQDQDMKIPFFQQ